MVFGVLSNLAVPILFGISSIDRLVTESFPPEHKFVHYNSVPVPIITAVIKTESEQAQNKQKDDIVETLTVTEVTHSAP